MNEQHPNQPSPRPHPDPSRSIGEIGHLFLSSVRDRQTGGQPRPVRVPPPAAPRPMQSRQEQESVDLTPEEFAQVFGGPEAASRSSDSLDSSTRIPAITALITLHLNGQADHRIREYARHLAANGERIGVLEVDGSDFRLSRFERSIHPNEGDPQPPEISSRLDHRYMSEALEEMGWDLDRWLLVLPSMRSPEARGLLKELDHWAVLSTCDHDGVVSCYRTLKGLSGGLDESRRPKMTLALLDAASDAVAAKVFQKLSSVCLQFLGIEVEAESAVRPTRAVAEHVVLHCRMTQDKAQLAAGVQWVVVEEFLARARAQAAEDALREAEQEKLEARPAAGRMQFETPKFDTTSESQAPVARPGASAPRPDGPRTGEPRAGDFRRTIEVPAYETDDQTRSVMEDSTIRSPLMMEVPAVRTDDVAGVEPLADEVIDLPGESVTEQAVVAAVLGGSRGELIECPVRAPMCPEARLAVSRDHGLVVLAVARKGLADLRAIAQAYRWTIENRALIAMAVPQLSIDAHRHPRLKLIVDQADLSAQVLGPMLENDTVSVRAYRKLRWGGKTGLLLEAA